jgi:hypothetical protein
MPRAIELDVTRARRILREQQAARKRASSP